MGYKMENQKLKEKFLVKAVTIHGDKYDYSLVYYVNSQTIIDIRCISHNVIFKIRPDCHINKKRGCGICLKNQHNGRKPLKDIISLAILKHGNIYNYDNIKRIDETITIVCTTHGEFTQNIFEHIYQGGGCRKCSDQKKGLLKTYDTTIFIEKAKEKHGDTYDYSLVDYINSITKVKIICKKHDVFEQNPADHLTGTGCSKCAHVGYSKSACEWLDLVAKNENIYIQHAMNEGEYKIEGAGKVDGYCKENNTAYEFHGTYFHGNPIVYSPEYYNKLVKKKMGELYQKTIKKENLIREAGYNLVVMWECDYLLQYKNIPIKFIG